MYTSWRRSGPTEYATPARRAPVHRPVRLPNRDTVVSLDYEQRTATITSREHSIGDAFVYLHKMPGPHNVDVRGNSPLMRWWRVLADATRT